MNTITILVTVNGCISVDKLFDLLFTVASKHICLDNGQDITPEVSFNVMDITKSHCIAKYAKELCYQIEHTNFMMVNLWGRTHPETLANDFALFKMRSKDGKDYSVIIADSESDEADLALIYADCVISDDTADMIGVMQKLALGGAIHHLAH